jgi:hypothetical protein
MLVQRESKILGGFWHFYIIKPLIKFNFKIILVIIRGVLGVLKRTVHEGYAFLTKKCSSS